MLLITFLLSSFVSFSQTTINVPSWGISRATITPEDTLTVLSPVHNASEYTGVVIVEAPENAVVTVTGTYSLDPMVDTFFLNDGKYSFRADSVSGSVTMTAHGNELLIGFYSSEYAYSSSFSLTVTCTLLCSHIYDIQSRSGIDEATISWRDSSDATQWTFHYGTSPLYQNQVITVNSTTLILDTVLEHTLYHYYISDEQNNCRTAAKCFITRCEGASLCEDFTDLYSCMVSCRSGFFFNPDLNVGRVAGRHTVMTAGTYDLIIGESLPTVPEEEDFSVRLGNAYAQSQAESITYEYVVDSTVHDLLLMRYAAVLQQPGHNYFEQPRFKFDIMDVNMDPLDATCYSADYIADTNLGWNKRYGGTVLWKEWTPVGINLAPLHGETIFIKLTTFDCAHAAHFGYAYFTLHCTDKIVLSANCGEIIENEFTAPIGFSYRWYREENPDSTLSTERTIAVTDSGIYCCYLSGEGPLGSTCGMVMKAIAGFRYPYAQFSAQLVDSNDCIQGYKFTNESVIANNPEHTRLTTLPCESYEWDLGDGSTSTERNPLHYYMPGIYPIRLIASLSNGACQDTAYDTIVVTSPCSVWDTIVDTICQGEGYRLFDTVVYDAGIYDRDSMWTYRTLFLTLDPVGDTTIYDTIVENQLPHRFDGRLFPCAVNDYIIEHVSPRGCVYTIHYYLHVYPNILQSFDTSLCFSEFPFMWHDRLFDDAGHSSYTYRGQHGEDSTLTFSVIIEGQADADFVMEPGTASVENHIIRLSDHSRHSIDREWFIDGVLYSTEGVVHYDYPIDHDSVSVTLVAISALNCNDTLSQTIYLQQPSIWVPNAFTPEEATNNLFCIKEDNILTEEVFIYTRTGIPIAHFDGMTECWDGTLDGRPLPQGVYVYFIRYTTIYEPLNPIVKKGTILLIR